MDNKHRIFIQKTFIALLVLSVLLTGCMDEFLDIETEGSLSPKNFYENKEDAVAAIYGVYERLGTKELYNNDGILYILANASDEARPFGANDERVRSEERRVGKGGRSRWWSASHWI